MAILIGHASQDENKKYKNGKAGDQTTKEVTTRSYYVKGDKWDYVIRFKTSDMAEKAASACEKACKNDKIGYDQSQRNTLLTEAEKVKFDLSKIKTACECDCSALMCVCAIAAGVDKKYLYIGGNLRTTSSMQSAFKKVSDIQILTASKYLTSDKYLKRGDILVKEGSHTVMALENGSEVVKETNTFKSYLVKVTTDALNIRKGPGTKYDIVGTITDKGIYTIIDESMNGSTKWGLLKSGASNRNKWISLSYTQKR